MNQTNKQKPLNKSTEQQQTNVSGLNVFTDANHNFEKYKKSENLSQFQCICYLCLCYEIQGQEQDIQNALCPTQCYNK